MNEVFSAYANLRDTFPEQACITWVSGVATRDVVRGFGGDYGRLTELTWNEVCEEAYGLDEGTGAIILLASHGDCTVVVEPVGFSGSGSALLRELSAAGEALSLHWTVNHDARISYAAHGELVTAFDPLDVEELDSSAASLNLTLAPEQWREDWMAAALTAGEELSGIRLDRTWFDEPHLGLVVATDFTAPQRPALLLDDDAQGLVARDPRIAAIAAVPTRDKLPEIALIAAEMAVRTTGLRGELIDEALELIAEKERGVRAGQIRGKVGSLANRLLAQARGALEEEGSTSLLVPGHDTESGQLLLKHNAARTLVSALNSNPEEAA
ncbi:MULTISPECIES: DUF6461 domain-containing protein [Streptosporangium]|uniref:Uncharacterized protein n=1 Tax=Streptosporangium brasiliense TaxID=47480 RepID=A0ABT9R8Q2_9ACTN|nr:DUF6461 domain-containing protein [Streptosporangium brasiliense]MDP9865616.1 hypothetical protein [Streptosporangium brasiliense]